MIKSVVGSLGTRYTARDVIIYASFQAKAHLQSYSNGASAGGGFDLDAPKG